MRVVLFDDDLWRRRTFPLSLTRPVPNLRVGILTIDQKWEKWLQLPNSYLTAEYLQCKYPLREGKGDVLLIRGDVLPDERLVEAIVALAIGEVLMDGSGFIALKMDSTTLKEFHIDNIIDFKPIQYAHELSFIRFPEDIFSKNGEEIEKDFQLLTKDRTSASLSSTNRVLGDHIFAEEGASAECSTLNTLNGPIYLGKDSEIWEGCLVRGAFALGERSQLKMGARIYSNVSIGPCSRVGGELNTCVIWGNSSKGHDGYLGSAVIGEWCNWGADTNNSNLKNNYQNVRLFDYEQGMPRDTGLQFCGLIMGDFSRCAINTAFNTGTVVGVSASIFGAGVPPTFIPDFSWGGAQGFSAYHLHKMFETAELIFHRRNREFDETERSILQSVFEMTKNNRNF